MAEKELHTEKKIIEAARIVFIEKGMSGARMQEIADKAGVNKASLHYYYRSKEKLFNAILEITFKEISTFLKNISTEDQDIETTIRGLIDVYFRELTKNPFLPNFIINEFSKTSSTILDILKNLEFSPSTMFQSLDNKLKEEGYSIKFEDFFINNLSLIIFPFAISPMINMVLFGGDDEKLKSYMESRKESIFEYIMNALKGYKHE